MIGATFCSGIGAPEAAAPWVDWRFASEIEPLPPAADGPQYKALGNSMAVPVVAWIMERIRFQAAEPGV